jgi:hypothetical protein
MHTPPYIAPARFDNAEGALALAQTIYRGSVEHLRGALQRAGAFGGHEHGVAGGVERVVQHGQVVGHVVHDQHQPGVGAVGQAFAQGPAQRRLKTLRQGGCGQWHL